MVGGLCEATEEGTPQGGPLSPLLSNVVLDELDKELERRGLQFVRFADDCVIYVKSKRAGDRVKESITRFISRKLKLKVNETKSGVIQPGYSKYLGFGFTHHKAAPKIRIHSKSLKRFRRKVRELTKRTRGRSIGSIIWELNEYHPRLVGLLLALRDTHLRADTQRVDTAAVAGLHLETVEAAQNQTAGTAQTRPPRFAGQTAGRDPQRTVAHQCEWLLGKSIANPILHPYTRSSSTRIT